MEIEDISEQVNEINNLLIKVKDFDVVIAILAYLVAYGIEQQEYESYEKIGDFLRSFNRQILHFLLEPPYSNEDELPN